MVLLRFDQGELLRKPYRSDQGHIRFDCYATRTGVFRYRNEDGSERLELRHPDDVFHPDHLASLGGLPETLSHPPVLVTPDNFQQYGVGVVGDEVDISTNPYIRLIGNVQRADAIKAIDQGIREISLGYTCDVEEVAGVYNGEAYTHRQRNLRGNHMAIVPKGRAGKDCAIRVDGVDGVAIQIKKEFRGDTQLLRERLRDGLALATIRTDRSEVINKLAAAVGSTAQEVVNLLETGVDEEGDIYRLQSMVEVLQKILESLFTATWNEREKQMAKIKILDAEYEVSEAVATAFSAMTREDARTRDAIQKDLDAAKSQVTKLETEMADVSKKKDEAQGRADQAEDELNKLKSERTDSAELREQIKAELKARADLEQQAAAVLDEEARAKLDSMTDREVHEAVVKARSPKAKLDGESDEYVKARFDAVMETFDSTEILRDAAFESLRSDAPASGSRTTLDAAYAQAAEDLENAWKSTAQED
jgi:uncharacterized protein